MKNKNIKKDIIYEPPFSTEPVDFEITSGDFLWIKYEFINYLTDNDIDDKDRKYIEGYLSIIKKISKANKSFITIYG